MELYWRPNFFLGKVIFDHNANYDKLLLRMEEQHVLYEIIDQHLQCTERVLLHDWAPPPPANPTPPAQGN